MIRNGRFTGRHYIALVFLISHLINICIATIGFYVKYGILPELRDVMISTTMMMPLAKPIALGGFLHLFNPYKQSIAFPISLICYWSISLSFIIYTWKTKKIWPFICSALLGALASPLWFIVAIGLFYI